MTAILKYPFFFILSICAGTNTFSQNKKLAAQEDKLAKIYSKMLSFHNVNGDSVDLGNIVEPYERDDEFISYDPLLKIVYIPFINEKNELTNKNLLYQLKGRYFEYMGVERANVSQQCKMPYIHPLNTIYASRCTGL